MFLLLLASVTWATAVGFWHAVVLCLLRMYASSLFLPFICIGVACEFFSWMPAALLALCHFLNPVHPPSIRGYG